MATFRVVVEAQNLPAAGEAESLLGFFATRFCETPNGTAAETMVLRSVRNEFNAIFATALDAGLTPSLHVIECEQVDRYPDAAPSTGATWFPME